MKIKFVTILLAAILFQSVISAAVFPWEKLTVGQGCLGVFGDFIETCFEIETDKLCLWEECGLKFLERPLEVDLGEVLGKGSKVIGFKFGQYCCKIAVQAFDQRVFFFSCRIKDWLKSIDDQGRELFGKCLSDLECLFFMFCHDNNNLPRLFLESSIEFCANGFVAISLYSFHGWEWLRVLGDPEIKKIDLTYEFGLKFTFVNQSDLLPRFGSGPTADLVLMSSPTDPIFNKNLPKDPIGKLLCSWTLNHGN